MKRFKVQVWIYYRDQQSQDYLFLLLLTRPERQSFWQPVTGGVDSGEGIEDAALREAREETGLSFVKRPHFISSFEFISRSKKFEEFAYGLEVLNESSESLNVILDAKEHVEFKWVFAEKALSLTTYPSNQEVLRQLILNLHPLD